MYIVSGATGHTGAVVAKTLLKKGLPVRVIVRSQEKGAEFAKLGAEVAVADLQDAEALTEALSGGKVLYLMNPPAYGSEDQFAELEKVIEAFQAAIKNSALEKIVVLSSIGSQLASGTGNILTTYKLEQAFGDLDIPVTFIRAGSFMENWNGVLETAKTAGVLPSFYQPLNLKIPQVAAADIGRVAAESMQEKTDGKEVKELAGFWTSPEETAEAVGKVLGKEVKAVPVPEDQWVGILANHNSPKNAASLAEMFAGFNSGHIKFETENQIAGKITIEDYMREALK
ncbi:MAG TPA: NmrA family NAD(P)-binding protein [Pyrinomonadaceae bacterium]|nr:NmrA family NAD(P)-binding protein [Pyrinomonadaceae bacterium]